MSTVRSLARILERLERYDHPRVDLEQYPTPPEVAARLVHFADLRGDIADRTVVDLGSGPGILALGCAFRDPIRVVGVEIDPGAIAIARANERRLDPPMHVAWIRGDAVDPPLRRSGEITVVMNPPFGAQRDNVHADRAFLGATSEFAAVSYSLHNAGSRSFVESFVANRGGKVTDAIGVVLDLEHQFDFQEAQMATVEAELFRIEWQRV